jgi:hypothetical protein
MVPRSAPGTARGDLLPERLIIASTSGPVLRRPGEAVRPPDRQVSPGIPPRGPGASDLCRRLHRTGAGAIRVRHISFRASTDTELAPKPRCKAPHLLVAITPLACQSPIHRQLDAWVIEPFTIVCDDLVASFETTVQSLMEFLRIPHGAGSYVASFAPDSRECPDSANDVIPSQPIRC